MTKSQFKEALLRGQGRCVPAVKADPEKYYDVVLWACKHECAFDTQCEGTRAWLVYQLICCYPDKPPFLETAIAELRKTKPNGGWKISHLTDLLDCFAKDGHEAAKAALWDKYGQMYDALMARKRRKWGLNPERDEFERFCGILADTRGSLIKIAGDIGRLQEKKGFGDAYVFDCFYESRTESDMRILQEEAERSEDIARFLKVSGAYLEERHRLGEERRAERQCGETEEERVSRYVDAYLTEQDPDRRAEAIRPFAFRPFPGDPAPIIADVCSESESLRYAAWQALEKIRHPAVREFAMTHLQSDPEEALPVLITNYQKLDAELLTALVKAIPVDFEGTTGWHGAFFDVLHMEALDMKAPAQLLRYIYESSYCSCCRELALHQMGKRRLLTQDILQECLYDANDSIRKYAWHCISRRKKG